MKIAELVPDSKNANKGTKRGNVATQFSLERFGAGRSIVVDRDNRIIAGNHVALNAPASGIEDAIVVESDGSKLVVVKRIDLSLDDPKARELAIADNRASELGLEWDAEVLAELSTELDLKPFFTDSELTDLFPPTNELDGTEDGVTDKVPTEPITKLGDLYILGDHRLLCGDATSPTDVASLLDGVLPDMVFTDPPYGISVQMNNPGTVCKETILGDETTDVASAAYNLCAGMNVPMIFWGANHYAADARLPNASCWLTWDKQGGKHIDQADCELAWTNIKGPARMFQHIWDGFRRDSEKGERRVHPTQKPVALIAEILDFFKAGKTILDLFGGSGSTLIACERTKRSAYLMELDPKYCDAIVHRWETLTGMKAVLHGGKTTSPNPN